MRAKSSSYYHVFFAHLVIPLVLYFTHASAQTALGDSGGGVPVSYGPKVKKDERWPIVSSDYGEITAVKISDGINGFYYLQFITMQPQSMFLPVQLYSEMILHVNSGSHISSRMWSNPTTIIQHAATPLFYRSTEELKLLLTRGIFLIGGKTLFCLDEKGRKHIERIFIEACLTPFQACKVEHQDNCVNSRFPGGQCYKYEYKFKARVRGQYLTPQISYTLNLVLRYEYGFMHYNPLRYKIDGEDETKVFIIYPTYMREDGWFIVPLYHFTSQHKTADLQFEFDDPSTRLLVSDFEFQPSEEKVELQVFEEFQHIVEVASQSLFYTSLYELKRILSKGVHLNGYKTWFSLNEIGEHCHMISIKDCLIPNEDFPSQYQSNSQSRFPAGLYQTNNKGFITHVKTHFLSPLITYTVNLVFDISSYGEQAYVDLKYRLKGETPTSTVYLANKRKDDRLYMAELYQFTSEGSIVDLEIMFDDCETNIGVEGILFQPLEIVEDDPLLKNLHSNRVKWFQCYIDTAQDDTAQEWSYLDKNEMKCVMLSARVACFTMEDGSKFEFPLVVSDKRDEYGYTNKYIYLVSPPNTPFIGQKFDENSDNPLSRHKLSSLPQQRTDGWMEVKAWEFESMHSTTVSMHLKLEHPVQKDLTGLIIYGIELRPI
ncbi:kinase-like domain, phloem protein 2-like protein [Tanacetum coccineum]